MMRNILVSKKIYLFLIVLLFLGMGSAKAQTFTFSSSNPAISSGIIVQGATKQIIYRAVVQVTGVGGANFTNLTFTPTGTFVPSDINTTNNNFGYRVWAGTTDNIATANSISNLFPPQATGNPVSITINSPYWTSGNTYYLWITADISPTAVTSHTLTVGAISLSNFTFSLGTKTGSLYAGGTQTIMSQSILTSSGTFTVPSGVTQITVECWGGGAGGANSKGGSGGGGGAYAKSILSVTPGTSYSFVIGTGGSAGSSGTSSSFGSSVVVASGGTISSGGNTGTGTTIIAGGNGGLGSGTNNKGGGGGGSSGSAGTVANGSDANGGTGGAGGNGTDGDGGNGGSDSGIMVGAPGTAPGGGGGGSGFANGDGGAGANGQIIISWTSCTAPSISVHPSALAQALCENETALGLSVTASGDGLSYQWYKNSTASTIGGTPVGTNSPNYTPVTTTAGTSYYYCVVSGSCSPAATSNVSGAITVNAPPSAPNIGTITQPTCVTSAGSVVLNGLPTGTWTLTRNPGGIMTTGTGTSTTVSNLSSGTYTFTVTNDDISGLYPGSGTGLNAEYFNNMTLTGTPALTRTDATVNFDWADGNPGSPIGNDNFSVRWTGKIQPQYSENYTFTTRSDDGIRLWVNGTQIINNWTDHAATENTGTISLIAGQKYDLVLEFYENGGEAVAQLSWNSTSQSLQIIPQTQLYFEATACTSSASGNVTINAVPAVPATPTASVTVQPTCAVPTGTIVITAPTGAQYEYQLDAGTYQASATFSGVSVGSHTVKARLTASPTCISPASSTLTVNAVPAVPATPTASVTVQPTCALPTGTIVITAPTGAQYEYQLDAGTYQASATFSGVSVGSHTVKARLTASPTCISPASTSMTVNAVPAVPATPTASVTVQPTCAVPTGTIVITAPTGAQYEYQLDAGTYQASATFSGVSVGSHTVKARLTASPTCISPASTSMTVNAVPTVPANPTARVTVQPTCAVPTGTIVITAPTGGQYEYQLDAGAYQASATFTGVSVGNHTVKARLAASTTCISPASSTLTVNSQPATPVAPILSTVTQPTCSTATGSFTITNYDAAYSYAATPSTGVTISGNTVTAPAGSYTLTATLGVCTSTASASVTVNAQPVTPAVTSVNGAGTFCGSTTITASGGSGGTIYFQGTTSGGTSSATPSTSEFISTSGTYYFRAQSSGGCWGPEGSATVTIVAQPVAPGITKIPADATVCAGQTLTVGVTAGTGGAGTTADEYRYNNGSGFTTWSTSVPSFAAVAGTNTIESRRTASGSGCTTSGTNQVSWTVDPATDGGNVTASSSQVCYNTSTTLTLTGSVGTIQWQTNATGSWADIPEANGNQYISPDLTATTSYRAVVTTGVCASATSNEITVTVSGKPTMTCQADITSTITQGLCSALVSWVDPTLDANWCGTTTLNVSLSSGGTFFNGSKNQATIAVGGTTTVTYTATDAAGNTASCHFDIVVGYSSPPSIDCPPGQTIFCAENIPVKYADLAAFKAAGGKVNDNMPADCGIDGGSFKMFSEVTSVSNPVKITRTYQIADKSGTTVSCEQVFTIKQPAVTISSQNTTTCIGGTFTMTDNTVHSGTIYRKWQTRPNSNLETEWTDITGETASTYEGTLGSFAEQYRLLVSQDGLFSNDLCFLASDALQFSDLAFPSFTGYAPIDQTLCAVPGQTSLAVNGMQIVNNDVADNCTLNLLTGLTYSITGAGATTAPSTGVNLTEPTNFNVGVSTVTYTVTDAAGNATQHAVTITIKSAPAPITVATSTGGEEPKQCTTYTYLVDNGTTDPLYTYAWNVYSGSPATGSPILTSSGSAASFQINWTGDIAPGTYTIEAIKKAGNDCESNSTLVIELQNSFDLKVESPGSDCKQETNANFQIRWDITRLCGTTNWGFTWYLFEGDYNVMPGSGQINTGSFADLTGALKFFYVPVVNADSYTQTVYTLFIVNSNDSNDTNDFNKFYLKGIPETSPISTD